MGDFILEHKKLSIFVLLAVIFYFFIAVPMERVFENKRDIEIKQKRYMGILKTEKIIKENIKKLKIRKEELSKIYEEKEKTGKKYTSVGEFQKEIDILFFKNNIEIKEIGRNIFKEDKCTIPYTVVGTEKDIINFLFETDKNENLLIFSGPFEFGKENKKIKLRFGAEIKIEDKNENNKIEIYERLSPLISESENEIKLLEYKMIGEEKGIFYIRRGNKEIKRYYLKNNDFVNFNKNKYKVELSKNRLMFINLDKGEKIIFYLGDDGEKNNNKD